MERQKYLTPEALQQLPNAVLLAGIECSGKTSFYRNQLSVLGYKHFSFDNIYGKIIKSPKKIVETLTIKDNGKEIIIYPRSNEEMDMLLSVRIVEDETAKMADVVSRGRKVVLDGTNTNIVTRSLILEELRKRGVRNVACIWMSTPVDECVRRLKGRGEHPTTMLTEEIIRKHYSEFVPPTVDEGFDLVLEASFPNLFH